MLHRVKRIILEPDVVHPIDHGMSSQKFSHFACILHVAFHTERKRLNSLQEQKAIERRQRSSGVSLTYGPATSDKRSVPVMVDIDYAVIGNLRPIEHVIFFRILAPRELAAIDDHP